jgi:hypothetical protein
VALGGAALGGALVNAGLTSTVPRDALDLVAALPELVHATARVATMSRLEVRTIR